MMVHEYWRAGTCDSCPNRDEESVQITNRDSCDACKDYIVEEYDKDESSDDTGLSFL